MARRGGYTRDVPGIEWAKLGAGADAEGKLSAGKMGQDYFTWMNDAVMHHVYRCEKVQAQQLYRADMEAHARGELKVSPQQWEPKYQVSRPKPEITMPGPGGAAPSREPQARP